MRNNKKFPLLILSTFFVFNTLMSCNDNRVPKNDHDSDGLINEIDPDPENNAYDVQLNDDDWTSNTFKIKVDYNSILKEGYQPDVALLCSFIMNDADGDDVVFLNNKYEPSEPSKVPILDQIGCEDVEYIESDKPVEDPYDISDAYIGHHTFIDKNDIEHQVFFINIKGYVTHQDQWISNFDIGAADENGNITDGYKEFWKIDEHRDWIHRQNHKGFDVSATRVKRSLDSYIKEHENKNAKKFLLFTGHSRSSAIANLVAKQYIDEGVDTRAYSFNPPAVTKVFKGNESSKYNNKLFVFNNTNDLVSRVPCPSEKYWGFKRYGTNFNVNINEYRDLYKRYLKNDYTCNTDSFLDIIESTLADLSLIVHPSMDQDNREYDSNNVYEQWHYPNPLIGLEYADFSNETDVKNFEEFIEEHCRNSVGIYEKSGSNPITVKWHSKGDLLLHFVNDLITGNIGEDYGYYPYLLQRTILELVDLIISEEEVESVIEIKERMLGAHQQRNAPIMVSITNNNLHK